MKVKAGRHKVNVFVKGQKCGDCKKWEYKQYPVTPYTMWPRLSIILIGKCRITGTDCYDYDGDTCHIFEHNG